MQDSRFPDSHKLARQLAEDLAERMRDAIAERGRVCIAVSGGNTPVAFFKALSDQSLPWDKVLVTLVDERWVNDDEEVANALRLLLRPHVAYVVEEPSTGQKSAQHFNHQRQPVALVAANELDKPV